MLARNIKEGDKLIFIGKSNCVLPKFGENVIVEGINTSGKQAKVLINFCSNHIGAWVPIRSLEKK